MFNVESKNIERIVRKARQRFYCMPGGSPSGRAEAISRCDQGQSPHPRWQCSLIFSNPLLSTGCVLCSVLHVKLSPLTLLLR